MLTGRVETDGFHTALSLLAGNGKLGDFQIFVDVRSLKR